jgi:hypothetical protein
MTRRGAAELALDGSSKVMACRMHRATQTRRGPATIPISTSTYCAHDRSKRTPLILLSGARLRGTRRAHQIGCRLRCCSPASPHQARHPSSPRRGCSRRHSAAKYGCRRRSADHLTLAWRLGFRPLGTAHDRVMRPIQRPRAEWSSNTPHPWGTLARWTRHAPTEGLPNHEILISTHIPGVGRHAVTRLQLRGRRSSARCGAGADGSVEPRTELSRRSPER